MAESRGKRESLLNDRNEVRKSRGWEVGTMGSGRRQKLGESTKRAFLGARDQTPRLSAFLFQPKEAAQ